MKNITLFKYTLKKILKDKNGSFSTILYFCTFTIVFLFIFIIILRNYIYLKESSNNIVQLLIATLVITHFVSEIFILNSNLAFNNHELALLKSLGAGRWKLFFMLQLKNTMTQFIASFLGLIIFALYALFIQNLMYNFIKINIYLMDTGWLSIFFTIYLLYTIISSFIVTAIPSFIYSNINIYSTFRRQ